MIPKYHVVYYKNHTIHYMNGLYKIDTLPSLAYLSFDEAKREVDRVEKDLDSTLVKFFDNLKQLNDKTD